MNWIPVVLLGLSISTLFACGQEAQIATDITGTSGVVGTQWQWQTFQDAADGKLYVNLKYDSGNMIFIAGE